MTRILIVDDETKLTETLKAFLVSRGFQVWTADTGDAALRLLQTHQPEVLLLDLHLGGHGLQGLDVLRHTGTLSPHTVILVISACTDPEIRAEVVRLGARRYLDKPLSLQDLQDTLHRVAAPSAPC